MMQEDKSKIGIVQNLKKDLKFKYKYSLKDGLKKLIEW